MAFLQEWIHSIEEGRGARIIRIILVVLGFITLALFYDIRNFKNFASEEAMDAAQLARNIADGRGYTTDYIRPLSLHLVRSHRADRDPLLRAPHPDLANAPVYPVLLAGVLKLAPVEHRIQFDEVFRVYGPERWIGGFNQLLFLSALLLVFKIAGRLFDRTVAWLTVLVFLGAEVFWRFSLSGLPTLLLTNFALLLFWIIVRIEALHREELLQSKRLLALSAVAGGIIGVMALTRYSFGWLIFPVGLYLGTLDARYRAKATVLASIVFLAILGPWIARNIVVSGTPFGTAGYAIFEQTAPFPGDTLQRSLDPDPQFGKLGLNDLARKLLVNLRGTLQNDLPRLGGSWVSAFFLVGLLVPFRNPALSRLRWLVVLILGLLVIVQSWGQTHITGAAKDINSENLIAVLAPIVFIFGVAFFVTLVDQLELPFLGARQAIMGLFVLIAGAPLIFSLLPPRQLPYAFPPYFPPPIQRAALWLKPEELMMSDIPGAIAWYGGRQCSMLTLDYDRQFYAINDDMKPVSALLLSPATLDSKFFTETYVPGYRNQRPWQRFALEALTRGEIIAGFPLRRSNLELLSYGYLFFTDWERWNLPGQ